MSEQQHALRSRAAEYLGLSGGCPRRAPRSPHQVVAALIPSAVIFLVARLGMEHWLDGKPWGTALRDALITCVIYLAVVSVIALWLERRRRSHSSDGVRPR